MSINILQTHAWQQLEQHFDTLKNERMVDFFAEDKERACKFSLTAAGLLLDYSKNRITSDTLKLLCDLAESVNLKHHIEDLFTGKPVNNTEDRPALHTLLRDPSNNKEITETLHQMELFINSIYQGEWLGHTGKPITDIVNIGIGGSDLGPRLMCDALKTYQQNHVRVHFVANIDGTDIFNILRQLTPETTLFIIASKSFTTIETLTNAETAKKWLLHSIPDKTAIKHHFVAVSAKPERAVDFGIAEDNVFAFWDWVGGRFSLWSAIGLPIALAIGMENFKQLLHGAHAMDCHFREAPLEKNMPVLLALISIWYINFFHCAAQAIIPYDENLALLPNYLQQLDMESNGKSVDKDGDDIFYETAPIIWGGVGSNGQHAFHQLLHQSRRIIPVDFIIAIHNSHPYPQQHELLYYNCVAQSQALLFGLSKEQAFCDLFAENLPDEPARQLAKHKAIPGNKPSNTLVLDKLSPQSLGALIALYEHKVFVQGIIWQINSFDQYGVELGKHLAKSLQHVNKTDSLNSSTQQLLDLLKKQ
jgi:glucose-6-phosphate isomerase